MSSRSDQQVGENVAIPVRSRTDYVDITAAPRAVLRESVRLLYRVMGEERLGTARGNAWAAVCADRERARERAEMNRILSRSRAERTRQLDSRLQDPRQSGTRQSTAPRSAIAPSGAAQVRAGQGGGQGGSRQSSNPQVSARQSGPRQGDLRRSETRPTGRGIGRTATAQPTGRG